MKLKFSLLFLLFSVLTGCGSETDTPNFPQVNTQLAHRSHIDITIKKGASEWKLERGLEFSPEGYRLSTPITLPVDDPDEIILFAGPRELAKLSWNPKMRENTTVPFANRSVKLEFRSRPEPLQIEWLGKSEVSSFAAEGKVLLGGIRVKNNAKYPVQFQLHDSGWARLVQEIRNWRMAGTDPCFFTSEYSSRELTYDLPIKLGSKISTLQPQETRVIPVFSFGDTAQSQMEWKLPVSGPAAHQRNYLYLGKTSNFPGGLPPGALIVCLTNNTVVSRLYDFPMGLERRPPVLQLSEKMRKLLVSYLDEEKIFTAQDIPAAENFLTFSN